MTERGEKRVADRPSAVIPGEHCETRDPLAGLLAETVGFDCSGGYGLRTAGALGTSGSWLCASLGRDDVGEAKGLLQAQGQNRAKLKAHHTLRRHPALDAGSMP